MPENRNCRDGLGFDNRGTVCIDTHRILDCCRDRDCFEDTRVYLSAYGEQILQNATSIRARSARMVWAYVGLDEVPFNNGFYRITVRYFIHIELEACLGIGKSQCFHGLAIVEKEVILFGGDGNTVTFSSEVGGSYCGSCNVNNRETSDPIAKVQTVEPIILGTRIDCSCDDRCCCDICDIPETIRCTPDGEIVMSSGSPRLLISLGIFSVIRIERPAQLLLTATDYSVPDKECTPRGNDDNPCRLFRTIAFPIGQFRSSTAPQEHPKPQENGCGCQGRANEHGR